MHEFGAEGETVGSQVPGPGWLPRHPLTQGIPPPIAAHFVVSSWALSQRGAKELLLEGEQGGDGGARG